MQAIIAKYLKATPRRGARVKAYCESGSFTVGFHEYKDPYNAAVDGLLKKLGWRLHGVWIRGDCKNYAVFVCDGQTGTLQGCQRCQGSDNQVTARGQV